MRKSLSFLKKLTTNKEYKFIFISIFCFLLCLFILNLKRMEYSDLKKQLHEIMDEKAIYERLYNFSMDYGELMTAHSNITKKLPENKNFTKFLVDIEKWANKKNITIISVNPKSIATKDVADVVINSIPFEITVNGYYDSLLDFISELENYPWLSSISGIELNTLNDSNSMSPSFGNLLLKFIYIICHISNQPCKFDALFTKK